MTDEALTASGKRWTVVGVLLMAMGLWWFLPRRW